MWRIRNVLSILLVFFLWDTVFSDPGRVVFGYDRAKILTYVFGLLLVKSLVTSTRAIDIAGEISQGTLTDYLLKPVSYFKYWFARDMSSKALNVGFAFVEALSLFLILKPPFFIQKDPAIILLFILSVIFAAVLFYLLMALVSIFPLWYPEQAWGLSFLLLIFADLLGGGVFPLDILPTNIQSALYLMPFPYLVFMPIQIYLGKLDLALSFRALAVSGFWIMTVIYLLRTTWNAGLKVYRAEGR